MVVETDTEQTQQALIERIVAGDKRAFEALFGTYGERVFRYAFRIVHDAAIAEEVANDVMLQVWNSASEFASRSKVSTWILGITRHVALNAIRRKQVTTVDIDATPEPADASASDVPAHEHDRAVLKTSLKRALTKLSPDHREVIELTFFQGLNYQEIAQVVGCPENTVKTRMFHAKKQLRTTLQRSGLEVANLFAVEARS